MKNKLKDFEILYNTFLKLENSDILSITKRSKYFLGPVYGFYLEKKEELFKFFDDEYSDDDILSVVLINKKRNLKELKESCDFSEMTKLKLDNVIKEISLLEDRHIVEWLNKYWIKICKNIGVIIENKNIRGMCYIYYGYYNYKNKIKSKYNNNIDNLEKIYGVLPKESEFKTYKIIEMDSTCEILPLNPPRFYDSKVNKTIYLANVNEELLRVFILLKEKKLFNKISLRPSNCIDDIFPGKYELEILKESLQFGKAFSIDQIGKIPITKLSSDNFQNSLWVKIDEFNITFEEICENDDEYENSIITQVIHLEYIMKNNDFIITHIDHEFIFYSKEDYKKRNVKNDIKGEEQKRLKSFKIDKAKIPINYQIHHKVKEYDGNTKEVKEKIEEIPFLIYILKSYFKHHELIDEYFEKMLLY